MTSTRLRRSVAAWLAPLVLAALPTLVAPGPAAATTPTAVRLKVGEFNIEYGGTHISFDQVVRAIRKGGAEVVGIEEAQAHIPRLAHALGWPYFSERLQVVSKLPLIDPPGADGHYLYVEVAPGRIVALQNVHLPSNPYGPFRIQHGATRSEVLAIENRLRVPAIQSTLDESAPLVAKGVPVFLVGDFNTPTKEDWTRRMVGVRPQIRYPVRWPVSVAVENAGFVDSYRAVHPNPMAHPGLTWWAARPKIAGYPPNTAPQDRIDLIYATPNAKPTASVVVGEQGNPNADVQIPPPWPSDHRSVVSTFSVRPAAMPNLVAVSRMLRPVGKPVVVRYHSRAGVADHVTVVPAGGDPATDGIDTAAAPDPTDGTVSFDTTGWSPGGYQAVLVSGGGAELSRIPFWIEPNGGDVRLSTGKHSYVVGQPIHVSWTFAPARRWDWIGIYRRGRDPHVAYYLLWTYTGATVQGSTWIDADVHGPWPLPAGKYSAYLLTDDGYKALARADFSVTS